MRVIEYLLFIFITILCLMVFTVEAKAKFIVLTAKPLVKSNNVSIPEISYTPDNRTVILYVNACGTQITVRGPATIYREDNQRFVDLADAEMKLACGDD